MMRGIAARTGILLLALTSVSAPSRDRSRDDVIVTGKRAPPIEVTRKILRAITPRVGGNQQLPRMTDAACVKVGGVKLEIARAIADRIVANAAEAGMAVGKPSCTANILVMIATDGRAEAQEVLLKQAYIFDGQSSSLSRFTNAPGPARVFAAKSLASMDGDRPMVGGKAGGALSDLGAPELKQSYATRMGPMVRRVVDTVILIIDRSALVGKTPTQIADYATMRVLAGANYSLDAGDDTILSLLHEDSNPPTELTRIDRSLLMELYRNRDLQTAQAEINAAARAALRD